MTDEFDDVFTQLESLRFTPDRSKTAARSGLQNFLDEAARLRSTVSERPARRLTGWIAQLRLRSKFTQERSPMLALAIKLVLVLAVMFGGAGVTVVAAQGSLPNEALYPIKLLVEEAQSSLAASLDAQIDTQLDHAQQRVREMAQLAGRGAALPSDVLVRLQAQLQAALQISAQLDDQHLQAALDRIQLRTQDQLRDMDRLHLNDAAQVLTRAREMAQLGQRDPQQFRARVGTGRPAEAPLQPVMTPQADPSRTPQGPRASITPQPSHTPQATCTPQPQMTNTPQNHSYGPGPLSTQQPVARPVGQGEGHEDGPGPQPADPPGGGGEPQGTQGGLGGTGSGSNGSPEPGGSGSGGDSGRSGNGGGTSGGGSGRP